jgi:hypothetical protein
MQSRRRLNGVRLPILAFWGCHQSASLEHNSLLRPFQATSELGSGTPFRSQLLYPPSIAAEKWLIPEMSVDSGEGWRECGGTNPRLPSILANARIERHAR